MLGGPVKGQGMSYITIVTLPTLLISLYQAAGPWPVVVLSAALLALDFALTT